MDVTKLYFDFPYFSKIISRVPVRYCKTIFVGIYLHAPIRQTSIKAFSRYSDILRFTNHDSVTHFPGKTTLLTLAVK